MSKLKDSMMKSEEKLLERAFRLMEYKYLATKYKQDMKHRAVGGVDMGMVAQMDALEILDELESYILDFGCSNDTLELVANLRDKLIDNKSKCCDNCFINYQRCKIFMTYWKGTETNTVEDSKCFYCMKHKFKGIN